MAKIDAITIPVRFEVEWLEDLIRRLIREELDARQGEEDAEALQAVERELGKPRRVSGTRCGPEDPRVAFRKDGALAWNDYTHEKLGRPESVHVDRGERILQIFPSSGSRSLPVQTEIRRGRRQSWYVYPPRELDLPEDDRRFQPAEVVSNESGIQGLKVSLAGIREVQG